MIPDHPTDVRVTSAYWSVGPYIPNSRDIQQAGEATRLRLIR